jgi:hypothetical protein
MLRQFLSYWIPRLLFLATLATALFLILLVCVSPVVHNKVWPGSEWSRVLLVFAEDVTLRRTTVASALGLIVTGVVFFRVPGFPRRRRSPEREPPSSQMMAGA